MAKEPTKRDLLERIEGLERKLEDLRQRYAIHAQDGDLVTQMFTESMEKGQRKREAAKTS